VYSEQSLTVARAINDRYGQGAALDNLGTAYFYLSNYTKAIEYGQQSLAIVRAIQNRRGEVMGYQLKPGQLVRSAFWTFALFEFVWVWVTHRDYGQSPQTNLGRVGRRGVGRQWCHRRA
jgi:tetratricopeptide (TPR) repeat protein